jgi:hypothetical protein
MRWNSLKKLVRTNYYDAKVKQLITSECFKGKNTTRMGNYNMSLIELKPLYLIQIKIQFRRSKKMVYSQVHSQICKEFIL